MTAPSSATLNYTQPTTNCHQFRVPSHANETIALLVTPDGIIIDIEQPTGEVIRTSYLFWSDLDDLTRRSE
tara:strand:- start:15773 stop:15985 length:213 start_codon:yes stop_codon:yes gene_type:complete